VKWRDHLRLTRKACTLLGIDNETANKIVEASIEPDKVPDIVFHHSREALRYAFKYAFKARMAYLRREDFARPLGRALHYIQDYFTTPPLPRYHDAWEESISRIGVSELHLHMGTSLNEPVAYKNWLDRHYQHPVLYNTPQKSFDMATYATSATLSVVLSPRRVGRDLRKIKRKRNRIVGAFLISSVPALLIHPGLTFFSILLALSFYGSYGRKVRDAELEAMWFRP
jgi:hypothetical protein